MAKKAKGSADLNTTPIDVPAPIDSGTSSPVARWKLEVELALKAQRDFIERGRKVVKRYRDERDEVEKELRKFNLLWSNVQTLGPALYSKPPKVQVGRRFNDADKVGRIASMILERGVEYELERYDIGACMKPAVQDRLLPGRGAAWVRYHPKLTGAGDTYEKEWECTPIDYVYWEDFLCSPARVWEEVRWVARRTFPSREQLCKRFGDEIGKAIPLTAKPSGIDEKEAAKGKGKELERGEVWEIWDRETTTVRWIATGYDQLCDERADPLTIEGFFPCPKPLFATMTSGTLVPVPDYAEYQDQAIEIDDLTGRIASLTKALKVVGLYDKSNPELQRLLNESLENQMVAVDNWAAFAEKGGIQGQVSFMPLQEVIETLTGLYQAREQVLNNAYQITGMADIVRGASNPNETATAQQIKGKYANLRLSDLQMDVERFARDLIRIKSEIMAERYSPETLIAISGIMQAPEFCTPPKELQKPPPPPQPPQQQPGQPPDPQAAMQAQQQAQMQQQQYQQALQQWQQGQQQILQQAIQLLKSPKFRDLRIDIETQSMVQMDEEADKQGRTEFITAMASFLQQGGALLQVAPQAAEMLGEFMRFAARGFRAGREMEATIDRFVESMDGAGQQQNPDQAKAAQAEKDQMQQGQMKLAQAEAGLKEQGAQQAMQLKDGQHKLEMDQKDLAHERVLLGKDTTIAQLKFDLLGHKATQAQGTIDQAAGAEDQLRKAHEQLQSQAAKPDLAGMLVQSHQAIGDRIAQSHGDMANAFAGLTKALAAKRKRSGVLPSGKKFEMVDEVLNG